MGREAGGVGGGGEGLLRRARRADSFDQSPLIEATTPRPSTEGQEVARRRGRLQGARLCRPSRCKTAAY